MKQVPMANQDIFYKLLLLSKMSHALGPVKSSASIFPASRISHRLSHDT